MAPWLQDLGVFGNTAKTTQVLISKDRAQEYTQEIPFGFGRTIGILDAPLGLGFAKESAKWNEAEVATYHTRSN